MIAEHFLAVQEKLETDDALSGKVFDTARMDASGALIRDAYLILTGGMPKILDDLRFTKAQASNSRASWTYQVRAVAPDAAGVRYLLDHAFLALVGAKPTIDGRRCDPVQFVPPPAEATAKIDASVNPPLFFDDASYWFVSYPL